MNCQHCHEPLRIRIQPALVLGRRDRTEAECINPACPLRFGTAAIEHFPLTAEQVEGFTARNARIQATRQQIQGVT